MKKFAFGLLVLLGVLAASNTATAQVITSTCTANCTVVTNQAFAVQADDSQSGITGYRLWDGNVLVSDLPTASARSGNVITFQFPNGLTTTGAHNYQISAYNSMGDTKSAVIVLTVLGSIPVPTAPTNVRIIK